MTAIDLIDLTFIVFMLIITFIQGRKIKRLNGLCKRLLPYAETRAKDLSDSVIELVAVGSPELSEMVKDEYKAWDTVTDAKLLLDLD